MDYLSNKREDTSVHTYRIAVKDFISFSGLRESDRYYSRISEMANSLTQKNIVIKDKKGKKDEYYSWFDFVHYKWGEGDIVARLSNGIRPFLLELKEQYTVVRLEYALLLQSDYAYRLYDLLKQYESIGQRVLRLDFIKEIFDVSGKYKNFKDFRIRVLEQAQEEIKLRTDISFDYFPITEKGRKVVAVLFKIKHEAPVLTLENREETDPQSKKLFQILVGHGVADNIARKLVHEYDSERIEWHIEEFEKRRKDKSSGGRPIGAGWIIRGIKADYRPQQSAFEKQEEEERRRVEKEKKEREKIADEVEKLKSACDKESRETCMKIIEGMTEAEQQEMFEHVVQTYGRTIKNIEERIAKEGFKNQMIRGFCFGFIKEKFPETKMSYYEYGKQKGANEKILALLTH